MYNQEKILRNSFTKPCQPIQKEQSFKNGSDILKEKIFWTENETSVLSRNGLFYLLQYTHLGDYFKATHVL